MEPRCRAARHRPGRLRRTGRDRPRRGPWFWVDLLGFVVTATPGALYLRGYDELTHHNLILPKAASPRRPAGLPGPHPSRPGPGRGYYDASAAERRGFRPVSHKGSARPSGPRTRWASPSSSSSTPPPSTGSSSARPAARRRGGEDGPLQHRGPRRPGRLRALPVAGLRALRDDRRRPDALRRLDVPQADRARRGVHRGRGAAPAPPGVLRPRVAPGAADLRHPRLAARGFLSSPAPEARGVQRLLRVPARPGRPPGGDLHQRLFHRRSRLSRPRWAVRDPRRRDFWGHAVIPTWYAEATAVLDLDGQLAPAAAGKADRRGHRGRGRLYPVIPVPW